MGRRPDNSISIPEIRAEDAERQVVGALLLNGDSLIDAIQATGLKPANFTTAAYRTIYSHALAIGEARGKIDAVTIHDAIERDGGVEAIGGESWYAALMDEIHAPSNAAAHAGLVVGAARRRGLAVAARTVADELTAGGTAEAAREALLRAVEDELPATPTDTGTIGELIRRNVGLAKAESVPWPWRALQAHTGGLPLGALTVIGAYPSTGKTTLTVSALASWAGAGTPCALFSVEMGAGQIVQTILGREAAIPVRHLMDRGIGGLEDAERARANSAMVKVLDWPLHVLAGPASAADIASRGRLYARKHGVKVVAVDYLQLLRRGASEESRRTGIDDAIGRLKGLAQTAGVAVIVLSQLSRGQGATQQPMAALLKESGGILEAADLAIILDRPHFREWNTCEACGGMSGNSACPVCRGMGGESTDTEILVKVEKHRLGPAGGVARLSWNGPRMMITDMVSEHGEPNAA